MNYKFFLFIFFSLQFNLQAADNKKFVIGTHSTMGLFSILFGVLNNIIWCEKNDKIPVVYWGPNNLYYQKSGYNGSMNVWEYYFEQVSNLSYKSGDAVYTRYQSPSGFEIPHLKGCYNNSFHTVLKFQVHKIINDYIKIKPNITSKIDAFYDKHMKDFKIVGIHLRGTDKKHEAPVVDPRLILNTAKNAAKKWNGECKFFIATDEQRLLDLSKAILGEQVIYYNSHRSNNNTPIHHSKGKRAVLAEEVLI